MNELAYYTEQLDKREGAMDWMLTDEEIRTAIDKVLSTIPASAKADEYFKLRDRAIARAAARKVMEWVLEHDIAKEHVADPRTLDKEVRLDLGDIWLDGRDVQAFKQEVGY